MKQLNKILIGLFIFVLILFGFYKVYVSKYYRSQYESKQCIEIGNMHIFEPTNQTDTAFIFYPGAKVEAESYAPLLEALSKEGILCICAEMPDNLAILDMDAAEKIMNEYPNIKHWYLGGHSLGGAVASMYLDKNSKPFEGLILLASYSNKDLSNTNLKVLSIYGTNDEVLNKEKMEEYKENYPSHFEEYVLEGGCHAYFGDYGPQKKGWRM